MAHGTDLNTGSGQKVVTLDRTLSTWPVAADGEMPASVLYTGATPDALSPVNATTPLPVSDTDARTSLAVMDDWDESDRAKVNPIVGEAGVAAGAGSVGATVQRVTLASDDPAVAALQTLDNAISGNEMQVDVVTLPAIPAGTNNIGDVDIASIAAGDNNIGNVDIVSLPAITGSVTANAGTNLNTSALAVESGGNLAAAATSLATLDNIVSGNEAQVDIVTQPARARTTDSIAAALQTDAILNGLTALTPKFAAIAASSSGDNTIVAAVPTKKIRVLRYSLSANGAVNAKFQSSTAGDITGLKYLTQYGAHAGAFCPLGLFETAAGEALELNLSGAVAVGGELTYIEV